MPILRRLSFRPLGLVLSVAVLGGCSSIFGSSHSEIKCPRADVSAQVGSVVLPGPGDEIGYYARMTNLSGTCTVHDDDVTVSLSVTLVARTENGAPGDKAIDLPYFVAVLDPKGHIIAKQQLPNSFTLENGKASSTDELQQVIPLADITDAPDYHIIVGYQVTAEQLAYSRHKLFDR